MPDDMPDLVSGQRCDSSSDEESDEDSTDAGAKTIIPSARRSTRIPPNVPLPSYFEGEDDEDEMTTMKKMEKSASALASTAITPSQGNVPRNVSLKNLPVHRKLFRLNPLNVTVLVPRFGRDPFVQKVYVL